MCYAHLFCPLCCWYDTKLLTKIFPAKSMDQVGILNPNNKNCTVQCSLIVTKYISGESHARNSSVKKHTNRKNQKVKSIIGLCHGAPIVCMCVFAFVLVVVFYITVLCYNRFSLEDFLCILSLCSFSTGSIKVYI